MREGGIEREIQHEAKPSAVFDSRGPPSAIISVVYERKRYINWFVVGSMAAACRRMAVDPKLLEQIDYDLPLDPNFDLGVGDWLRSSSEEDEENPGRAKSADLLPKKRKLSLSVKKKRQPLKEVGSNSGRYASPYEPLVEEIYY